jgi:hypothetical protein
MRFMCWLCYRSVTSDLPEGSIIRAVLLCPACIERLRAQIPRAGAYFPDDGETEKRPHREENRMRP